jgi:hypothetical protein
MGISSALGTGSLTPGVCTSATRPASPFEGQMIYTTDLDTLEIWNGSAWRILSLGTPTNGSVLQVVSTTKTDTFSMTSTTTFTDVTGLSVSITPKSSSSKILITSHIHNSNSGLNHNMFNLVRDSTNIAQPSADTYSATIGVSFAANTDFSVGSISHLDSPSTTSSVTYKIQAKVSGGTLWVNRRGDLASVSAVSSITLMEIAG